MTTLIAGARPLPGDRRVLADHLIPERVRGAIASVALVGLGAALLALTAQVRIPLPFTPVPITGQTFGVLLVGASLGLSRGTLALLVYIAAGILGAPVFTQGGHGAQYLLGPTGGYLVGFVVAAALLGRLAERAADRRVLPALAGMFAASATIYAFGAAGLMLAKGVDLPAAVSLGVTPFVVGDLLKAALAGGLLPLAWRAVRRAERGSGI